MLKRLVYFSQPVWLNYENNQLVARFKVIEQQPDVKKALGEEAEKRFSLDDLGFIVLDHRQITLTHPLLSQLAARNIALLSCDDTHHPIGLHLPLYSNTLQTERYRDQIEASEPLRKQLWTQLIKYKIRNQAAVLLRAGMEPEANHLKALSNDVKSGDSGNMEAIASNYYWQRIFKDVPGFQRKREGPPPNNMLNYGYAILRAITARALVASGLLPTLGLHHHNRYNPFCLADDMMEPYRPFVDRLVYQLVKSKGLKEELDRELKAELLSVPFLDVIVEKEKSPLMNAVHYSCQSLVKCFEGSKRNLQLPLME